MIIRVWRGKVKPGMHEKLERLAKEQAMPSVSAQPGLLAQYVGRPIGGNSDEFVFISIWENLAALKRFAGEKWEEAVVLPDEKPLLSKSFVHHYEAFHSATNR